jgi:hypothetical protein
MELGINAAYPPNLTIAALGRMSRRVFAPHSTAQRTLAARGESTTGCVSSAAGVYARRCDTGDVVTLSRSVNAADAPAPPKPFGRIGIAVQSSPHSNAALSLLVVNDVPASLPPRASTLPRKPYARDPLYFHHGLLICQALTSFECPRRQAASSVILMA